MVRRIRKRNGKLEVFDKSKIIVAIGKSANYPFDSDLDPKNCKLLVNDISDLLGDKKVPSVEEVQDLVEETLMKQGWTAVAKAYILYRKKRQELRETKAYIYGVEDELDLSLNAIKTLESRYLLKDDNGKIIENPSGMFRRVAHHIDKPNTKYGYSHEQEYFAYQ